MIYTIEELCTEIVDCEHKTPPTDEFGDFFAVGTPAMRGNSIDFSQARRISETTYIAWTRRMTPRAGDLLFAREAPVGPIVLIPDSENIAPGQRTMLMRPDPSLTDSRFLFYLLSSPVKQDQLRSLAGGSTVAHLNVADVRAFPLDVPSVADQCAIADVLSALDNKIAANIVISRTTDNYLATKLEAVLSLGSTDVALSTIADTNKLSRKPVSGGKIRYIDIAAVGIGSHVVPSTIQWDDAPSRARRVLRRGDTLWSTVRPNRRSHSLNLSNAADLVGSTGLAVLSPTKVGFAYLYEVTKRAEFTSYLETVAEGSAYPAVRADRFGEARVPLLQEPQLNAFEAVAAPMREHLHALSQENIQLAATRDALLPQLMSGKLRVKDAEKVLAGVL